MVSRISQSIAAAAAVPASLLHQERLQWYLPCRRLPLECHRAHLDRHEEGGREGGVRVGVDKGRED